MAPQFIYLHKGFGSRDSHSVHCMSIAIASSSVFSLFMVTMIDRAERVQEDRDFCGELSIFIDKIVYLNTVYNKPLEVE